MITGFFASVLRNSSGYFLRWVANCSQVTGLAFEESPRDSGVGEMGLILVEPFFVVGLGGFVGENLGELSERLALGLVLKHTLSRLPSVGLELGFLASD